jgi:hypothetical protein
MGGQGTASAADGDVSWSFRSWSTTDPAPPHLVWATAGGDFDPAASASLVLSDSPDAIAVGDAFSWTSAAMAAEVQSWLDGTLDNHGWLLRDLETTAGTLIRFYSLEFSDADLRPRLTIQYTPVPEPAAWLLAAMGFGAALFPQLRRKGRRTERPTSRPCSCDR